LCNNQTDEWDNYIQNFNSKYKKNMKTKLNKILIGSFMAAALVTMSSCQKELLNGDNAQYASVIDVSKDGTTSVIQTNAQSALVETAALTDSELASLLKMKEEEKLARDVYSVLYQKWESQVFSRISNAENNHLNAINLLLENYGVTDTLFGDAGVFTNSDVQTLYNDLISKASVSIEEAYKTGALIEEMDIKDLKDAIAATTNANITLVYENLERGSRNHLRSFNRQLTSLGIVYTPVYLIQSDYDQIVSSAIEKGKQYKMQGKGNGQGKGKGGNGQGNRGNGTCNL
jgi:hypothetical protein